MYASQKNLEFLDLNLYIHIIMSKKFMFSIQNVSWDMINFQDFYNSVFNIPQYLFGRPLNVNTCYVLYMLHMLYMLWPI